MRMILSLFQLIILTFSRAGMLKEAKAALLKARRVAPQDTVILYNIALVLQKLASQLLM